MFNELGAHRPLCLLRGLHGIREAWVEFSLHSQNKRKGARPLAHQAKIQPQIQIQMTPVNFHSSLADRQLKSPEVQWRHQSFERDQRKGACAFTVYDTRRNDHHQPREGSGPACRLNTGGPRLILLTDWAHYNSLQAPSLPHVKQPWVRGFRLGRVIESVYNSSIVLFCIAAVHLPIFIVLIIHSCYLVFVC